MRKIDYQPSQVRLFLVLLLLLFLIVLILLPHFIKGIPFDRLFNRLIGLAAWAVLTFFFYLKPRFFFPIFRLILIGTGYIGKVIFALISIIVFFLILTPMSFFSKLAGKKYMSACIDSAKDSYYEEPDETSRYENQF